MVRVFNAYRMRRSTAHAVVNDADDDDDDDEDNDGNDDRNAVDDKGANPAVKGDGTSAASGFSHLGSVPLPSTMLATALLDDRHLIVAMDNHCIRIMPLDDQAEQLRLQSPPQPQPPPPKAQQQHLPQALPPPPPPGAQPPTPLLCFPTLDRVEKVLHCKQGNYILTLESAVLGDSAAVVGCSGGLHRFACRVYTNWWTVDPVHGYYNTEIRARVAAKVSPDCRQQQRARAQSNGGTQNQVRDGRVCVYIWLQCRVADKL